MVKTIASTQLDQARPRRVPRLGFVCEGDSRAKQSFRDECDINLIMRKFQKTGVIEHVKQHGAKYGNFLAAPASYHEAANLVKQAEQMFLTIPAKVRKAFGNDPGELLACVEAARNGDADQFDRLAKLGLLKTVTAPQAPVAAATGQGAAGEPDSGPKGRKTSPGEGKGGAPEGSAQE